MIYYGTTWDRRSPEGPFYLSQLGMLPTKAKPVFHEYESYELDYPHNGFASYVSDGEVLRDPKTGYKYVVLRFACAVNYPNHAEDSFGHSCSYKLARMNEHEVLNDTRRSILSSICRDFTNHIVYDKFE